MINFSDDIHIVQKIKLQNTKISKNVTFQLKYNTKLDFAFKK